MKFDDLHSAIEVITGAPHPHSGALELGPGATYVLELPSRAIRFFGGSKEDFPASFYSLAASTERWDDLVSEADRDRYAASWESGPNPASIAYELLTSRRGSRAPALDYRFLLRDQRGSVVGAVGRVVDETPKKAAMEAQAHRSWKEIANAINRRLLHDFNNTIAGIYSLSELYAEPGSEARSMVEAMVHIRNNSIRAQEITRKIRQLATIEDGTPDLHDFNKLLKETEEYLQAVLPKGARIQFELAPRELPVRLDANRLRQALLHLASNALDAVGSEVAVTLRSLDPETISRPGYLQMEFEDNGPGFTPEALNRALQPLFTTKDSSRHPGLGLNVAADFARRNEGDLQISNKANGACVTLLLPMATFDSTREKRSAAASSASSPRSRGPSARPLPALQVYSWEDIARHPLLRSLNEAGWQCRIHSTPGDLLLALHENKDASPAALVFTSPLDESAEPLLGELQRARPTPQVAVVCLGEHPDAAPEGVKRNCGLILSGSSKPAALIPKLAKYFRFADPIPS